MPGMATHREVGAGGTDARDGRGGEERRLPPGPRAPAAWQSLQWVLRPVPFMEGCRRRFGDTFTLKLGPLADVVFLTEPESIKAAYQAPPELAHAGDINGLFRPILGSHSLLLLDGDAHIRQRKLMLPPFTAGPSSAGAGASPRTPEATSPAGRSNRPWPTATTCSRSCCLPATTTGWA